MSDEELLRATCECLMGWVRLSVALDGAETWRESPGVRVTLRPLTDEGFWLPRLLAECRRRGWWAGIREEYDRQGQPQWSWWVGTPQTGSLSSAGHDAAALARAMLAAAEAERET